MSGEELRAAVWEAAYMSEQMTAEDIRVALRAALAAPSTPESSGLREPSVVSALGDELVGIEARHAELLRRLGKAIQLLAAIPAASSTEPALDRLAAILDGFDPTERLKDAVLARLAESRP